MKPPFAYYGGKTRIADQIAAILPAHGHYVEPFAGSLAVLLAKRPSKLETINDIDQRIITFWRVLREHPAELIRACALTPHSRAEVENAREGINSNDQIEAARAVWVILSQSRGGSLRRSGWRQFVNPAGTNDSVPEYLAAYVDRMAGLTERMQRVSIECRPAIEVIASYGQHAECLIYADPPYTGAARNSTGYAHEMTGEDDHRELADALHKCEATVILSGYPSALYDDLYRGWHQVRIKATTTQGRSIKSADTARAEILWSNRPLETTGALFDMAAGQ